MWLAVACCLALFILKCCRRSLQHATAVQLCVFVGHFCIESDMPTYIFQDISSTCQFTSWFIQNCHNLFDLFLRFLAGFKFKLLSVWFVWSAGLARWDAQRVGNLKKDFQNYAIAIIAHDGHGSNMFQRLFHFGLRKNDITPLMRSRSNSAMMIWWD